MFGGEGRRGIRDDEFRGRRRNEFDDEYVSSRFEEDMFSSKKFEHSGASKLRVPVYIICGFLGSGKTTLVQNILRNREGLKIGIVVNDVAEANVDSAVLVKS
jgi:hypothetical protein